jgi:outer membrane protein
MTRSNRILSVAAAAVLALLAALPAAAQSQKIAVINTQEIVFESNTGKSALDGLKTLQGQKEQQIQTLQQEVTTLRDRLAEGRLSLAEDRLAQMQTELEEKVRGLRRAQEDAAADLEKRRAELLRGIEAQVMPVINQIGEEQGYDLIFNKYESGLVFAKETVDITAQVIQRLDSGAGGGGGTGSGQ